MHIKYKKYIFWPLLIATLFTFYAVISPFFYTKVLFNTDFIYQYFFNGYGRYTLSIRCISIIFIVYSYIIDIKYTYMIFSSGDIYFFQDKVECIPQVVFFRKKVISYPDLVITIGIRANYIKNTSSVIMEKRNIEHLSFFQNLFKPRIFFGINSMCASSNEDIVNAYNFVLSKSTNILKKGGIINE